MALPDCRLDPWVPVLQEALHVLQVEVPEDWGAPHPFQDPALQVPSQVGLPFQAFLPQVEAGLHRIHGTLVEAPLEVLQGIQAGVTLVDFH